MSRTNRRVVVAVRGSSSRYVERKLNEHILQSRQGWDKVDLCFHPGNKDEWDYNLRREAARIRDIKADAALDEVA